MDLQWTSDFQKLFPEGLMPGNVYRIRLFRVIGSELLMLTGVFVGNKGYFKSIDFPYFPLGLKNLKSDAFHRNAEAENPCFSSVFWLSYFPFFSMDLLFPENISGVPSGSYMCRCGGIGRHP